MIAAATTATTTTPTTRILEEWLETGDAEGRANEKQEKWVFGEREMSRRIDANSRPALIRVNLAN